MLWETAKPQLFKFKAIYYFWIMFDRYLQDEIFGSDADILVRFYLDYISHEIDGVSSASGFNLRAFPYVLKQFGRDLN